MQSDESGKGPRFASKGGSLEHGTSQATADEGLRLLRAFRAIACSQTRARILTFVSAEAQLNAAAPA